MRDSTLQVTPNLYGNLVANTAAGLAGGTGVMPGGKTFTSLMHHHHREKWILLLNGLEIVKQET